MCLKTDTNIPKAFSFPELSECHDQKLLPTGQRLRSIISSKFFNALVKMMPGKRTDDLLKNVLALEHGDGDQE